MSARIWYLAQCVECQDIHMPFTVEQERDDWALQHAEGAGHQVLLMRVAK